MPLPLFVETIGNENKLEKQKTRGSRTTQKNVWSQAMATLYLLEQGTSLFKEQFRFIIHVPDKDKVEVPIRDVERILLFGNINLSTPAIATCLESQINVLFLSPSGRYKGHLWSQESSNLNVELLQFKYHSDREFQFNTSKAIVWGKLINSKQLLLRLNRKRNLVDLDKAISGISADIAALESVDNIDSLRGYEGVSAARYFPAFGQLIVNPEFQFCHRHRQPPPDPVNALLSFGYTLLFNNVLSLIIAEGLSPYFGNFHYGEKKKPYLAFDLMEEFRSPIVDSLVLSLINKSILKLKDFESVNEHEGIYLTESGRRIFLNQFEKRMNEKTTHPQIPSQISYREAIQLQIRLYKRILLSSMAYEPFTRSS
jgi:CRISPR-associated protein Cas1